MTESKRGRPRKTGLRIDQETLNTIQAYLPDDYKQLADMLAMYEKLQQRGVPADILAGIANEINYSFNDAAAIVEKIKQAETEKVAAELDTAAGDQTETETDIAETTQPEINEQLRLFRKQSGVFIDFIVKVLNTPEGAEITPGNSHGVHYESSYNSLNERTITRSNEVKNVYTGKVHTTELSVTAERGLYLYRIAGIDKVLVYVLQKAAEQGNPERVCIDVDQAALELGYSTRNNMERALSRLFKIQDNLYLQATEYNQVERAPHEIQGHFFQMYENCGKYVYFHVTGNNHVKFDLSFFCRQFTLFPQWCYQLKGKAFTLANYIFDCCRYNSDKINENGQFTISYKAIQSALNLPTIERVRKSRHYDTRIVNPIEDAIAAIEDLAKENIAAENEKDLLFSIVPGGYDPATATALEIAENGYITVTLKGDYKKPFTEIAAARKVETDKAVDRARKAKKRAAIKREKAAENSGQGDGKESTPETL